MDPHLRSFIEYQASQAEEALQTIQAHLGRANRKEGRIRFPRGFIRRVDPLLGTLPKLGTYDQRRNVAYSLIATDVFRWLAIRTDLWGPALSMVVKQGIVVLGSICEWMTKEATRGYGSRHGYAARTSRLVTMGVIPEDVKEELDWMWETRCNIHLYQVTEPEYESYTRADYNRALRAYTALRDALVAAEAE